MIVLTSRAIESDPGWISKLGMVHSRDAGWNLGLRGRLPLIRFLEPERSEAVNGARAALRCVGPARSDGEGGEDSLGTFDPEH